jgi:hypothetical protein
MVTELLSKSTVESNVYIGSVAIWLCAAKARTLTASTVDLGGR